MSALFLAFFAGALTTINPCVLPLLPILAASAYASGSLGPVALGAGLVTAFTIVGVAISATGAFIGFSHHALRTFAALAFVLAGLALLVPSLQERLSAAFAPVAASGASLATRAGRHGLAGQFAVGLLAGAVWTPCSGPSLVAAFALAAEADGIPAAALRMIFFSLGAATVVVLLAMGVSAIAIRRHASTARAVSGVLLVLVGAGILTGADKWLESRLLDLAPDWYINLTTSV
jgi:cytochrome c-type biogenesis protein